MGCEWGRYSEQRTDEQLKFCYELCHLHGLGGMSVYRLYIYCIYIYYYNIIIKILSGVDEMVGVDARFYLFNCLLFGLSDTSWQFLQ